MSKKLKVVGGLSRKAKINIFVAVFIIFILVSIFSSINQISNLLNKHEKLIELNEKLNYDRNANISLLAEEKSLYQGDIIEQEARRQFNMVKNGETNFFVQIESGDTADTSNTSTGTIVNNEPYSDTNLWDNIRIFYNKEIKK
jgi:cell division protein FtsB